MKKVKKNQQDTTLRNLRVTRRQLAILYKATQGIGIDLNKLEKRVAELEEIRKKAKSTVIVWHKAKAKK